MNSKLYLGFVEHTRFQPVTHKFRYPLYFYGLDLDELSRVDRENRMFGYNRLRPASVHDKDYLDDRPGSIKDKLLRILAEKNLSRSISSFFLITGARYFNYIFNPVSFYYCLDNTRQTAAMVVEVNNTFGERHVYIPEKDSSEVNAEDETKYHAAKAFHVSPFNNMEGDYEFFFSTPGSKIDVRINLIKNNVTAFTARLCGTPQMLTSANLLKMMLRHPVVPHMTKTRIFMEAARLYFAKHLKYHDKPEPVSPMTIKRTPK